MGVSVIIPVLNEAENVADTLRLLRPLGPREVIVVDGGSADATRAEATAADLVLDGPRGRAAQMNLGAAHATGDVLLFLHADCSLEPGALEEAERSLRERNVVAGCYRMRVRARGLLYRAIDACAMARVRLTGFIYGDQGLFLRRELFERLGGFPAVRFMEDVMISRRLRSEGRIVVARKRIFVSPRRWERVGIVRQTFRNWALTALAAFGVHPDQLAKYYPHVR